MGITGWRMTSWTVAWGIALFGALKLGSLPGEWGHICGRWGCGPPLKALVAWHSFYAVVLAWPAVWAAFALSPGVLRRAGKLVTLLSLAGLAAIGVWEAVHWFPSTPYLSKYYFIPRYFFVLATLLDVPVVQLTLAGTGCWYIGSRRCRRLVISTRESGAP